MFIFYWKVPQVLSGIRTNTLTFEDFLRGQHSLGTKCSEDTNSDPAVYLPVISTPFTVRTGASWNLVPGKCFGGWGEWLPWNMLLQ